jgi:hypothetical protein
LRSDRLFQSRSGPQRSPNQERSLADLLLDGRDNDCHLRINTVASPPPGVRARTCVLVGDGQRRIRNNSDV